MTEHKENNSGVKKGLIIGFIIILLAANAILVFQNVNKNQTIDVQKATIETQEQDIAGMLTQLDSVQFELMTKKKEIQRLGGKVDELDLMLNQLKQDKEQLVKEKNFAVANLQKYKEKVDALSTQLVNSDKKIAELTAQRDSLFKYNQALTKKIEEKGDTIKTLQYAKTQLAEKVAVAASLKATNIQIDAINDKGKIKEGPELRARHIYKLKITFNLPANEIARVEGKDIYMRLIEPDGSCLFDMSTGGGMFKVDGKEIPYTQQRNILFENNNQKVSFNYMKGSNYKIGKHTIELYADGFKIGEGKFDIL